MQPAVRIIIEEDSLDRIFVERGPGVALVPYRADAQPANETGAWRGCGPERGEYEDARATEAA